MKPAAVDYVRAASLGEAIERLAQAGGEARVIAGGQSLVAMMNLRVASPALVVDIARLPELGGADDDGDSIVLGACLTHAMIEDGRVPDPSRGLLPHAAATLAYRAIRNRGTLGGSLALADPAAEWPAVMTALDAEVLIAGPAGRRAMKCDGFATGVFETALAPAEILAGVRVRKLSPAARWGYVKLCRKLGEFAQALAVAVVDRGGARVVLGAGNGPPLLLAETSRRLAAGEGGIEAAVEADLDRAADRRFDAFERALHRVAARRSLAQVMQ